MSYKIKIPLTYDPNPSVFINKASGKWTVDYVLPTEDRLVKCRITLPVTINTQKKAEQFATKKRDDLLKGILNENEYTKILKVQNFGDLKIEAAANEFFNVTSFNKTGSTKSAEKKIVPKILNFFKDKYELEKMIEIKERHIIDFKNYLLNEAKKRKEMEMLMRGKLQLLATTEEAKKELVKTMKSTGLSPATAQSYFKICRTIFSKLEENKKIPSNPAAKVKPITLKSSDKVRSKSPTIIEIRQVLDAPFKHQLGFPIKEFIVFLKETGARFGEAQHLEWFDIQDGVWHLKDKPNCPTKFGIGWSPKWGKSRQIALTKTALDILNGLPKQPSVGYIKGDPTPYAGNFVFTCLDKGRFNHRGQRRIDSIKKAWTSLLKAAGLPYLGLDKIVIHDFRRYRNWVDENVHRLSTAERGTKLGNSGRINETHYRPEMDAKSLKTLARIQEMEEKILELRTQLERA